MKRLTHRTEDGKAFFYGTYTKTKTLTDTQGRTFGEVADKLAHYEDLEEQGGLHSVPKPFWDEIMNYLVKYDCPYKHGLKSFKEDNCKIDEGRCRLCWEFALKGGGQGCVH